jgi:hypothetical protein
MVADRAIEQNRVEPYKDIVTNSAWAMYDRPMGNRSCMTNANRTTGFGMNHHAILNIRIGTYYDSLHVSGSIHFVRTDYRVRANEYILPDNHLPTYYGSWINERCLVNHRIVSRGIFSNHCLTPRELAGNKQERDSDVSPPRVSLVLLVVAVRH